MTELRLGEIVWRTGLLIGQSCGTGPSVGVGGIGVGVAVAACVAGVVPSLPDTYYRRNKYEKREQSRQPVPYR